jgi:prevent-host-death family protein
MSKALTASAARTRFAELVNRAEYAGERTIVHRRKKPVAALVPIEDLELLERYEDELDRRLIKKARKEKTIPWEQVKKDLGL